MAIADNSDSWMSNALQYTKTDVIFMDFDFYTSGESYYDHFSEIVDSIGWVSWFYGQTVDNLAIIGHGNSSAMVIGDYISTSNYTSYYSDFSELNTYMDHNGQIQLYHCLTGNASTMLNTIAGWTDCDIFANTDLTYYYDGYNYYYVTDEDGSSLTFEYKSDWWSSYVNLFSWDYS